MSHFLEAEVKGLAGRTTPVKIVFDRHVNIIYGLNGSGKTSLLKILYSAMKMDATQLLNVPFSEATVKVHSINYATDFTLHLRKSDLPSPKEGDLVSPGASSLIASVEDAVRSGFASDRTSKKPDNWKRTPAIPDRDVVRFACRYLPTTRLHVSGGPVALGGALTEERLDQFFAEAVNNLWAAYSAEIVRIVRDAQEKGLASILRGMLAGSGSKATSPESLDSKRGYESAKKFLERQGSPSALGTFAEFKKRFASDSSLQNVVGDIFNIEKAIEAAMAPLQQLQALIRKMYSGNKKISFTERSIEVKDSSGRRIGLASLSSGEKHLMQLFVETLLVDESSILIDEPEISIHVDWQRELVRAFRILNPRAQFLLASHSPEVMAEVDDERIFAL